MNNIDNLNKKKIIKRTTKEINTLVDDLLSKMTIEEKIGQLYESSYEGAAITGPEFDNSKCLLLIKEGKVGSIIGQYDNKKIYHLQKKAVEESRLGIPLLFCNDIIHGCRIAFPINLAMSCSWNPSLIKKAMKVVAYESSHSGVNLTFSPMLDLVRDPRWGRVMESNGEDPYLSKEIARAYIEGYQGDLSSNDSIASCCKHFVGYGACVGGRDYDSVDMSEDNLFQNYLPPFKAAIDAKTTMIMTSFNTFNGTPMSMNKYLLKDVLRKKLGFKGIIISDYTSTIECLNHKTALNEKEVALKCMNATVDHEMIATSYLNNLKELVDEELISGKQIDEACKRMLFLKYQLGLFDDPYKNVYFDFEQYWLKKENLDICLKMAEESICLLKNDNILPLSKLSNKENICFVGPFVKEKRVIGAWGGKANENDTVTIFDALTEGKYHFSFVEGYNLNKTIELSNEDKKILQKSNIVVMTVGEDQWESGECTSKANITISKVQEEFLEYLINLGKRVVMLVFAGRPLILTKYQNKVDGLIYTWFLGTMSGKAIVNVLYGKTNPSGKLTMSFPYDVGQIPVYYNHLPTGRPYIKNNENIYRTRYLDIPNDPLYPFGYGLSYSRFLYGDIILSSNVMTNKEPVNVQITITNDSEIKGQEIVELYIEALNFSVSRPVKELKRFKKVMFKSKESKLIEFSLTYKDLQYYTNKYDSNKVVRKGFINEEGMYRIYIGASSNCISYKNIIYRCK